MRSGGGRLHVAGQELAADLNLSKGSSLTVGIRPDDLVVSDAQGLFEGVVNVLEPSVAKHWSMSISGGAR